MEKLWNKSVEQRFFTEAQRFATPEQLFYVTDSGKYVAYWPKGYRGTKSALQSRNALIGNFTERWTTDLINECVRNRGLFAVQGAICNEIALSDKSPADVVISKKNGLDQCSEDILAVIEVKISIVWNWELKKDNSLIHIGDYKTHQGNPGLLRSDSMLKAIGKAINIRVSSFKASKIPIVIMGNTPITKSYYSKVDQLKITGIIQGFWSVNPRPLENNGENIKKTENFGFYRFDAFDELKGTLSDLLTEERNYFSSMKSKRELGIIIEKANKEKTYEKKAEVFLKLINE